MNPLDATGTATPRMADDDTLTGLLAALRRMIARGEHRSDLLGILDRIEAMRAVRVADAPTAVDPDDDVAALRAYLARANGMVADLRAALDKTNATIEALREEIARMKAAKGPIYTEPVDRRNGRPHVHSVGLTRGLIDHCHCGAVRSWTRRVDPDTAPSAWVETAPVSEAKAAPDADESEPPPGFHIVYDRAWNRWLAVAKVVNIGMGYGSREAAVAACWAAYRAQQPATVTAPEPRTELGRKLRAARAKHIAAGGTLLSADEISDQLGRTPAPEPTLEAQLAGAQSQYDAECKASRVTYAEILRIEHAIAARDGKAGAK